MRWDDEKSYFFFLYFLIGFDRVAFPAGMWASENENGQSVR